MDIFRDFSSFKAPLACTICCNKFSHKQNLNKHMKAFHYETWEANFSKSSQISCPLCETSARTMKHLMGHLLSKHETQIDLLSMTGKTDVNSDVTQEISSDFLVAFSEFKLRKQEKPVACLQCPLRFKSRSKLRAHIRTHTGIKPFTCGQCGKKLTRKGDHVHRDTDKIDWKFICDFCGMGFLRKSPIICHMRCHTNERPCLCNICGKTFRTISALKIHALRHTKQKSYLCPICAKSFYTKANLKTHMMVHGPKRKFSCNQCDKHLSTKVGLMSHLKGHTGEKPFTCEVCDKRFSQKALLAMHLMVHTKEKPCPCSICGKCFRTPNSVKRHMISHTQERLFSCPNCEMTFSQKCSVTRHLKICKSKIKVKIEPTDSKIDVDVENFKRQLGENLIVESSRSDGSQINIKTKMPECRVVLERLSLAKIALFMNGNRM